MSSALVGIVNFTPDSFSDGDARMDAALACKKIEDQLMAGAVVVDIGAESTRPGATPLSASEEWDRLSALFAMLAPQTGHWPLSLDTRHPDNAKRALDIGFRWINDVSGFVNPHMVEAVKHYECKLVMMHSLSVPADKALFVPETVDIIGLLDGFARAQLASLQAQGVEASRVIFDPGIGFGKTAATSRQIMQRIAEMKALGVPILVGHSRKSFLAQEPGDRDQSTLRWSLHLRAEQVDYIRVHDVAAHVRLFAEVA